MTRDERHMRRANFLAGLGLGTAAPNPIVGAVVVVEDQIVGEGYHHHPGGPHAEVVALASVPSGVDLSKATVYVTLEPCAHHGRTPPCADLLIKKNIERVVIGHRDPFVEVDGRGVERLRHAGIEVILGCLEAETRHTNRRFLTFHEKKRPYVILKWAQTADGFLAPTDRSQRWISGPIAKKWVHKWRSEEAAILVGAGTVRSDNPSLTTREWSGRSPQRIVLDQHAVLTGNETVFSEDCQVWHFTKNNGPDTDTVRRRKTSGQPDDILTQLHAGDIQSVLVEGGASILNQFIDVGLWDEMRVFRSGVTFGDGIPAPSLPSAEMQQTQVGMDELLTLWPKN